MAAWAAIRCAAVAAWREVLAGLDEATRVAPHDPGRSSPAAPEQITLAPGSRLRLRLVNTSTARIIAAAIEGVRSDPVAARTRAERASTRLAKIEWRQQRQGYLELVDGLVAGTRSD